MKKLTLLFVLLLVVSTTSLAQQIRVSGTVYAADNLETIPGAGVIQVGTSNGVVTDIDGNYTIVCPSDCTLEFSALGYITQEVDVNGRTQIDVELEPDAEWMNIITPWAYIRQKTLSPLNPQP